jgi:branched-subunit amino acid transport protein
VTDLLAVLVVGLGTYATRASFIITLADRPLPPLLQRAVRNVGPAVLSALVASLLVGEEGITGLAPSVELAALAAGGLVAWRWKNIVLGLTAGMAVLWIGLALAG